MGKASKWFRGLFGLSKKPTDLSSSSLSQSNPTPPHKPQKKKWSFVKSSREKDHYHQYHPRSTNFENETFQHGGTQQNDLDPSKHAIAVAAATAAVAEAAVAAAHAAAEVVRLTSSGRPVTATAAETTTSGGVTASSTAFSGGEVSSTSHVGGSSGGYGGREEWAAVKIQSHFRAYLSRRALRALKALVKLQALVRGHIVRKHTADNIGKVQALLRVQSKARVRRSQILESPGSVSKFSHPGPATPEKFEHVIRAKSVKYDGLMMLKRNGSRSDGITFNDGSGIKISPRDDDRSYKILEVDPGMHATPFKRRSLFHSSHLSLCSDQYSQTLTTSKESTAHQTVPSLSSYEVQSFSHHLKLNQDLEEGCYYTADSSPQFYSASSRGGDSSRRGPFTPTKSDGSKSCLSGYSDHPNYMSYTESSKAKIRSLSAPKQRPQYERSSSAKRYSIQNYNDPRINPQRVSGLHANFTNKVYPGSGRLDRLGMPTKIDPVGFSGGHWHRV